MSGVDREGLGLAELDTILEQSVVLVPVEVRRREPDGALLVRCVAPSGLQQYFWIHRSQVSSTSP